MYQTSSQGLTLQQDIFKAVTGPFMAEQNHGWCDANITTFR
ncbi:hypothetical protein [Pseudoalteromonas sp. H105]|nr:hypothetical protein [Pseudoalteromonas sp. H105]